MLCVKGYFCVWVLKVRMLRLCWCGIKKQVLACYDTACSKSIRCVTLKLRFHPAPCQRHVTPLIITHLNSTLTQLFSNSTLKLKQILHLLKNITLILKTYYNTELKKGKKKRYNEKKYEIKKIQHKPNYDITEIMKYN